MQFGFHPEPLDIDVGSVSIRTLPNLDATVSAVVASEETEDGWRYAPPRRIRDIISDEIRTSPYSKRVFCLPKTHTLEHAAAEGNAHLEFHIWVLSFFLGTRLTTTEAGFLDATPIQSGKLVDFVLLGRSVERAIELAECFWSANRSEPRNAQRFAGAVHALFLGQYRQALQFERFIYLYTAIDACYALTKALRCPKESEKYGKRIEWMCNELGVATPTWARAAGNGSSNISALRNNAVHEALFAGEPFGFAVRGDGMRGNLTLEMTALVCRLLVALIGGADNHYLRSPVNTRQLQGLNLSKGP